MDRPLALEVETLHRIGGLDAPEWAQFGRVASVALDTQGYLYVLDQQAAQVTVVSPTGEQHAVAGRRGAGPGELRQPFSMTATPAGLIVVSDFGHRALVVFDRDGVWLRNVPLDVGSAGVPSGRLTALDDDWVSASDFLVLGGDRGLPLGEREATRPVRVLPLDEGVDSRLLTRAWRPPSPDEAGGGFALTARRVNGVLSLTSGKDDVFAPQLRVAADGRGRLAVVDSTTYRIRWYTSSGTAGREPTVRAIAPMPVTRRLRDNEVERRRERIIRESERPGSVTALGLSPRQMRERMLDGLEELTFYPEVPVIRTLVAGPGGELWVERWPESMVGTGPVDIFDKEGGYAGTWDPPGPLPVALGPCGRAAFLERDELDVAVVRVVRFLHPLFSCAAD